MNKKTIWYCHPTAGSPQEGMSYRPYYLAKYWKKAGHNAFIISASFHHMLHQPKIQKKSLSYQQIDNVDYIRLKTPSYKDNGIKRILSMFSYAFQITRKQKEIFKITGKPDVIIVSSTHPFHYLSLYPIAKTHAIPLIFEVRDLWPSSLIEILKLKPWHPLVIFLNFIEKHAYKHSKYVVSLLSDAKSYMVSKGMNPKNFIYIPNGTDFNQITEKEELSLELKQTIQNLKHNKQFLVGYAGSLGAPNAMEYFVQAMEIIQKTSHQIQALIVGKGYQKEVLKNYCKKNKINNVYFFDPIPKTQVHHFLKSMDLLYLGWQDTKLYQYGVSPNKIFDYMMAEKPIIESGGAPTSLVQLAGCGGTCPAGSPNEIAKLIINISNLDHKKRIFMGKQALKFVKENHCYEHLSKTYIDNLYQT
jgi:glycosyltransferase involved in cell wall biosynthesis